MSKIVNVRKVKFGEGMPKICIPITDADLAGLKNSVSAILSSPFDFVEWRADFYQNVQKPEICSQAMTLLRKELGEAPILFTIRTSLEMGKLEISTEAYVKANLYVINSGLVDLVDVELSRGETAVKTLVEAAHQKGVKIVMSRHDFAQTPAKEVIIKDLCTMQNLGADIAKFAVMPKTERDVLTMLDATLTMKEEHNSTPVITMSMGHFGMVSRVCGQLVGSCVTFGTAGKASAPGQLPATDVALFLKSLA